MPGNYTASPATVAQRPVADGTCEPHQAGPQHPQRRQFLIFESRTLNGKKIATKRIIWILELQASFHRLRLQISNRVLPPLRIGKALRSSVDYLEFCPPGKIS